MVAERRHISIHLAGTVVDVLDNLRVLWDPVMAGIAPPHVTLVYPEETVDERSLLVRVSETCERFGPIRIRIEEFAADNAGEGGVYALVGDPTWR